MATPVFNNAEVGELSKLKFENGGMGAMLSASGNTVQVTVTSVGAKEVSFAPPGGDWTASRTLSLAPRMVTWNVQLAADSDANLDDVESKIETYLRDGRVFVLTDGFGRSTDYGRLSAAGTRKLGRRLASGARRLQAWQLTFVVLWPKIGADKL